MKNKTLLVVLISVLGVGVLGLGVFAVLLATDVIHPFELTRKTEEEEEIEEDEDVEDEEEEEDSDGVQHGGKDGDIEYRMITPLPGDTISSPLDAAGEITGGWYFEGQFPVEVWDDDDVRIGNGVAEAQGDWMTEELVRFNLYIEFFPDAATEGKLVLIKANPSDLPENADQIEIPVFFAAAGDEETMTVKVFFGNNVEDPESLDCSKVYSTNRVIPFTLGVGRASINELLEGTTVDEDSQGFFTSIPDGVVINDIYISGGVAYIDFNNALQEGVGGSCRVGRIVAQITETLKQFPTVSSVEISIEGQSEDILQP